MSLTEKLCMPTSEIEASIRTKNALRAADLFIIGDLVQKSEGEMLKIENFGRKSLNEIKEILWNMGLSLNMKIPNWEEIKTAIDYDNRPKHKSIAKIIYISNFKSICSHCGNEDEFSLAIRRIEKKDKQNVST